MPRGVYPRSWEERAKISATMSGRTLPPEHKAAIGRALVGNVNGRTHGEKGSHPTRLYAIWMGMRQRVRDPNRKDFARYGGRGITVCAEWQSFVAFRDWARGNGYAEDLTIDRIDPDGGYEPANCQWTTRIENSRRRRNPSANRS